MRFSISIIVASLVVALWLVRFRDRRSGRG